MDYVYICRDGENEELRYSIRSVETNFPKGRVWVVGGKPSWYIGNYIPVENASTKQLNAIKNLFTITESEDISENFVLMNDDFFIINPVSDIKTYHGGNLMDKIKLRREITPTSKYPDLLLKAYRALQRRGIVDILDYELHVPMPMTKAGLREALEMGTQWRSTYGNLYGVGGELAEDVKVYGSGDLLEVTYDIDFLKSDYVSTDDGSFLRVYNKILKDRFPNPSSCEL